MSSAGKKYVEMIKITKERRNIKEDIEKIWKTINEYYESMKDKTFSLSICIIILTLVCFGLIMGLSSNTKKISQLNDEINLLKNSNYFERFHTECYKNMASIETEEVVVGEVYIVCSNNTLYMLSNDGVVTSKKHECTALYDNGKYPLKKLVNRTINKCTQEVLVRDLE